MFLKQVIPSVVQVHELSVEEREFDVEDRQFVEMMSQRQWLLLHWWSTLPLQVGQSLTHTSVLLFQVACFLFGETLH